MFSLPQLVNHFENQHIGLQQVGHRSGPGLDWTQDMILMPDVSEIPDLKAIIGGKGHKFNIVNEAVPWVFNKPNGPTQQSGAAWPLGGMMLPVMNATPGMVLKPFENQRSWVKRNNAETRSRQRKIIIEDPQRPRISHWSLLMKHTNQDASFGSQTLTLADKALGALLRQNLIERAAPFTLTVGILQVATKRIITCRQATSQTVLQHCPTKIAMGTVSKVEPLIESWSNLAGDPDDFSLTAALESHLAQDRDALARVPKAGLLEREVVRQERRSTARDGPPSDFPNYPEQRHMEVEVFDDARHGHSTQYMAESHGSRHTGHASEVSTYYHSPAVPQNSGQSSDNRSTTRYASATRPQSAGYEETYEIVHVRDAEGEYIVRRPILRERETHRVLYEGDTHHHQNRGSYSHRSHDALYGSMDQTPIPGERRDAFQMHEACTARAQFMIAPSSFAEYDSNNPASMSDPGAKRPSEY
ncbi:hypothetical protein CTAM01_04698 [Colletotrichum tamarilloi]|uniref:DUF7892 domain-containing protein n=1 Tax=Colletotrichum tamarilloi TaxID=1209934 RepID=A0ABQ9RGX6_9PEZI|nr:uncharacterized protein CTAM01_04698 [Colletotrichum tamarilloi]KAK1503386.1 hypothetical protein CTAM01_04698 [Colletotrichum tamarilloi]